MKIDDQVYELISGKLDDRLSPMEETELSDWLAEDVKHEKIYAEIKKIRDQVKLLHRDFAPDTENVLKRVKRGRGRQIGFRYWWKYAALFILPLGVALVLWQGMKNETVEVHRQFSAVSRPGGERAILKLYDGKTVMLDSTMKSSLIAHEASVRIEMDSNHLLRYSSYDSIGITDTNKNNELIIPKGGEYQVVLADGTKVWLNSASRLIYPQSFMGKERRVVLSGEAFFDVAHDAERPFIVETSRMNVKVLGTRFNVNDYDDNEEVSTTLVNGSVEIVSGGQQAFRLVPGEQAYGKENELEKREVNVRLYTSWIDGKFLFNNTELEEIAKQISRWYDVEIFFSSENVKKVRFTGAIVKFKPLDDLVRMIESTSQVRFSVKGKTIVISE
ncbi:FecR domain-containing protein [Butyricimonas paravirosa]|uniref:FecR domain-containing protein n=1 Tax=Butyricimonas paravirosa TaxID=1472417 RepID=UPI0022E6488B|nr:FecR domain-containing protein [Butyricimonas paravirosa]